MMAEGSFARVGMAKPNPDSINRTFTHSLWDLMW